MEGPSGLGGGVGGGAGGGAAKLGRWLQALKLDKWAGVLRAHGVSSVSALGALSDAELASFGLPVGGWAGPAARLRTGGARHAHKPRDSRTFAAHAPARGRARPACGRASRRRRGRAGPRRKLLTHAGLLRSQATQASQLGPEGVDPDVLQFSPDTHDGPAPLAARRPPLHEAARGQTSPDAEAPQRGELSSRGHATQGCSIRAAP
jgi:hypothetical protein